MADLIALVCVSQLSRLFLHQRIPSGIRGGDFLRGHLLGELVTSGPLLDKVGPAPVGLGDKHVPTAGKGLVGRQRELVIALSPIVDTGSLESLLAIRRRGCALVVVDVLPPDAIVETDDEVGYNALRLWRLERSMLIARLAELGVPVVQQAEPSSLAVALADVVRIAAGPHLIVR